MRQFVVLLLLAVAAVSASKIPEGRIINGYEATPGEAPFIVSMQTMENYHFCAGSLITERIILTAARCMTQATFYVVAGAHSSSDRETTQVRLGRASKFTTHNKYYGGPRPNDLGLLFLEESFDLSALNRNGKPQVSTISLPSYQYSGYSEGVLFGWGRDNSDSYSKKLQKIDLPILDFKKCFSKLPEYNMFDDTNICTFNEGKVDGSCDGDAGGPLVSRKSDGSYELVGVASYFYYPCASSTYPSIYTKVSAFIPWINEHMNDN